MDKTVVHCNIKKNAEIIARILDYDVDGEEFLLTDSDGTLTIELPVKTENIRRIKLINSNSHIGRMYNYD